MSLKLYEEWEVYMQCAFFLEGIGRWTLSLIRFSERSVTPLPIPPKLGITIVRAQLMWEREMKGRWYIQMLPRTRQLIILVI